MPMQSILKLKKYLHTISKSRIDALHGFQKVARVFKSVMEVTVVVYVTFISLYARTLFGWFVIIYPIKLFPISLSDTFTPSKALG